MINGKTKIYCLLGNPVSHTMSPMIHNTLFDKLNINGSYCAFHVEEGRLPDAIKGIKALGIAGCNVTIPYKQDIMPLLDYVSPEAKSAGAVNTIINENGKLSGYNTDVFGFMESLRVNDIEVKNTKVAIIGFGGAAKAVVSGLVNAGINAIDIYVRNKENTKKTISDIEILGEISYNVISTEKFEDNSFCYDIVINSTPVGMGKYKGISPVSLNNINSECSVVDLIYNPSVTEFMSQAINKGNKAINGLDMLIYQGLKAFEIWTGTSPDRHLIKELFDNDK